MDQRGVDFSKIKLIIWDMDETYWRGTLSEEAVVIPDDHIELIKRLTDEGIINSISSKNDEAPVLDELKKAGIDDYFVFNNINWEEKGFQIADKIKAMGLRAENVLFIDDNVRNLEEAKYYSEGLMTAGPDIIPALIEFANALGRSDFAHKRLDRYKLLERKAEAMAGSSSKEQFLYDSH
nr:HAD-IIIC family phosphatase [Lachnospiraceae bacterium]